MYKKQPEILHAIASGISDILQEEMEVSIIIFYATYFLKKNLTLRYVYIVEGQSTLVLITTTSHRPF